MNKKYTNYVMLGVIAMSVLLLSASPSLADYAQCADGKSTALYSEPAGAAVYIKYENTYLGTTGTAPLCINVPAILSNGEGKVLKYVKPGYREDIFNIWPWYTPPKYPFFILVLTPLQTQAPAPTSTPTPISTPAAVKAPAPAPTSTSGTLLINSNPSGATVTIANTGQNLGVTPIYINPKVYPSPTFLRLTKAGYQSKNIAIYNWMVPPTYTSLSYNLQSQ